MYQQIILSELRSRYLLRKKTNPQYSLRSFARHLDLPSGALSEMINGKRPLGLKTQQKIAKKLGLKLEDDPASKVDPRQLTHDEMEIFGSWYTMPLLDLLRTRHCPTSPQSMADRLGITKIEVVDGLDRLCRLNLCKREGKRYLPTDEQITTSADIPSAVLRKALLHDLANAAASLETIPVDERDFSTVTLCFDKKDLKEAKEFLRSFRRKFWKKFEKPANTADDVYQLTIALFPLTKNLGVKGATR